MKILYILDRSWGGIYRYAESLANEVAQHGDVTIVVPENLETNNFCEEVEIRKEIRNIESKKLDQGRISYLVSLLNLNEIIKEVSPNIIHFPEANAALLFSSLLNRLDKKYPLVYTRHTVFAQKSPWINKINIFLEKRMNFQKVIVHNKKDKQILRRKGIFNNISVLPHGAFFSNYQTRFREEFKSNGNKILLFGYLRENKGIKYILRALPIISEKLPNTKLVMAGKGDLSKYKNLIKNNKSQINLYNHYIPWKEIPRYFGTADVVVFPYSSRPGGGNSGVLTIALSLEKAIVATKVRGIEQMVEDGKEAILVPPKDSEALADAIVRVLKDRKLRKKLEKNSRKKGEELSWGRIAKKHLKIYKEII